MIEPTLKMPPSATILDAPTMAAPVPLFSLSRSSPHRTDPAELEVYYANRALLVRNVIFITIVNLGWNIVGQLIGPLMLLRMLKLGLGEDYQGTVGSINLWAVAFLVMLFSWTSDHTISRLGRRKPYLFISAPIIIASMMLFPLLARPGLIWLAALIATQMAALIFTDVKASTFSLAMIDCVPRPVLAQANAVLMAASGVMVFLVGFFAGDLIRLLGENTLFYLGGGVMIGTTLCGYFIKEPPIYHPPTERFKLWSTFKVAAADKRIFFLMAGVAMIGGFFTGGYFVFWYWASQTLHLSQGDIFQATSWVGLVNVALAYPTGWIIDHFGGFKVVLAYWLLSLGCFALTFWVHDKSGLIVLSIAMALVGPLYGAADIMVYKSCPRQEVGSITSTNSCIRNFYNGTLIFVLGWVIYFQAHDYQLGFVIGIIAATVGMVFFLIHHWLMRCGAVHGVTQPEDAHIPACQ